MIIDDIKKANMQAFKDKNQNARTIYSIVMNSYLLATVEARTSGKEVGDAEMVNIITKTIKELDEEAENYKKVGNEQEVLNIKAQKETLEKHLPKMLSESEIKQIIDSLEDKSVPFVMKHFKTNYNGKCDMKLVSDVLRNLK